MAELRRRLVDAETHLAASQREAAAFRGLMERRASQGALAARPAASGGSGGAPGSGSKGAALQLAAMQQDLEQLSGSCPWGGRGGGVGGSYRVASQLRACARVEWAAPFSAPYHAVLAAEP